MPRDLDLSDHDEVARRVVLPVLEALYREGELVGWVLRVANDRLLLSVTTVDEVDEYDLGWDGSGSVEAAEVAYFLSDRIEEYISETSFGWGEQRSMRGPIPGPVTDG